MQAIKQSNGTRADITKQLFKLDLKGSILGNVKFNANGDVTSNPVTIYRIKGGKSTTFKVIVPPEDPGQGRVSRDPRTAGREGRARALPSSFSAEEAACHLTSLR